MPDSKDSLLQSLSPTIMVPKYSPLSEIPAAQRYRFLMANDGLWIESKPGFGHFRNKLWDSPRPLPYGEVSPVEIVEGDIAEIEELIETAAQQAREFARDRKEWAGWIVWSRERGCRIPPLDITDVSCETVKFNRPALSSGEYLVLDLHSHPFEMDFFSAVDDRDDLGAIKYAGVFSFDKELKAKLSLRLCVEGFYFPVDDGALKSLLWLSL